MIFQCLYGAEEHSQEEINSSPTIPKPVKTKLIGKFLDLYPTLSPIPESEDIPVPDDDDDDILEDNQQIQI